MSHEGDTLPAWMKNMMTFINRVGFPIAICIWFIWRDATQARDLIKAMNEFTTAMVGVKNSIDNQTRAIRHAHIDE